MADVFQIASTGTINPVRFDSLGIDPIAHPFDLDFVSVYGFTTEELIEDEDININLSSGNITLTVNGEPITADQLEDASSAAILSELEVTVRTNSATQTNNSSSNWVTINFDSGQLSNDFTYSSGIFTAVNGGKYNIDAKVLLDQDSGNNRSDFDIRVQVSTDNGVSFNTLDGGFGGIYSRNTSQGRGSDTTVSGLDLSADDQLRVQFKVGSGSGEAITEINGCSFRATPVKGAKGAKGDTGQTGPGGTIITRDDNIAVDSATGILNFTGNVNATQTAPGNVQVDVPGSLPPEYRFESVSGDSSTNNTQVSYLTIPSTNYVGGDYKALVTWSYQITSASFFGFNVIKVDFYIDGAFEKELMADDVTSSSSAVRVPASSQVSFTLTAGNHTITIRFQSTTGDTVVMRNCEVELFRIS